MRRSFKSSLTNLVLATLVLAGCGTSTDDDAPPAAPGEGRPASVARVRIATDDYGFPSPFTYLLGPGLVNVNFQYDTLLWKDSTGEPIPWLAKEWSKTPDGKEWRFVLRDGVKWHDGQPFTADDVVFTFDYLTNGPGKGNPGVFGPVPGMEVVAESPTVVVVKLAQPIAPFEITVAGRTVILPKHVWSTITEPTKVRDPKVLVGTGPYRLESYDSAAPSYLFVANESYFLGVPYVRRIEFVPGGDELLALRRGEVDTAGIGFEQGVPDAALDVFEDPRFGKVEAPGETTTALHFNLAKGFPFDDKRFRQAVAYAVDRKDLVKRILLGRGAPGSMGGLAPSNTYAAADLPVYDVDVNRAKALLDEIGLKDATGDGVRDLPSGGSFRPELLTTPRWNPKTVELVQEYLKAVGIEVRVSSVDYPSFDAATAEARYELALIAYGGLGGDPDSLRTRLSSRLNPRSFSRVHGYVNPRFDDLAARQQAAVDRAERTAIVKDMQRIIADDVPMISLYLANRMQLFDKAVFDAWYFTPGGVFGGYPGILNKHVFVTGKRTGL
jgi:peptide/nickel transport system substrate-binding protein